MKRRSFMACVGALLSTPAEAVKGLLKATTARVREPKVTSPDELLSASQSINVSRFDQYQEMHEMTWISVPKYHDGGAENDTPSNICGTKVVKSDQQSPQEGKSQA